MGVTRQKLDRFNSGKSHSSHSRPAGFISPLTPVSSLASPPLHPSVADPARCLRRLAALLPASRVLSGPAQLAAYESDGLTAFRTAPLAVVVPETQSEVIAIVRLCHEEKLPFVARGSGTSLSGGSTPVAGGLVITLNRLNRILRIPSLG